jgi:hypothetical protein
MESGYLSLILGLLLSISEILPFIKSIQGNGIINVLQSFITKQREIGSNLLERMENETEPLLQHPQPLLQHPQQQEYLLQNLSLELSTINDTLKLNNDTLKLNNDTLKLNNVTFSLKTPDQYQLMYIDKCMINDFTKILKFDEISHNNYKIIESLGFRIDFNPSDETYIVHI